MMNSRQSESRHRQSRQQSSCAVGFGGRVWDVSNLKAGFTQSIDCSTQIRQRPSLYPSTSAVRDIPENDANSIFDPPKQSQCHTRSYKELVRQKDATQLKSNPPRGSADFRQQFTIIAQKTPTCHVDEDQDSKMPASSSPQRQKKSDSDEKSWTPGIQETETVPSGLTIEVEPGVYLPLRGAVETEEAMRRGRVRPTKCLCCETHLYCIMTAELVVCPVCMVVGPLEFQHPHGLEIGGVGLGLTSENLQQEMG